MNQMSENQEKKLKNKSFLMRSDARADFKIKPSVAMDIAAVLISVAFSFLVWLVSSPI